MMDRIRVIDFETSSLDEEAAEVIEAGWFDLVPSSDGKPGWSPGTFGSTFVRPTVGAVTAQASGIHHLVDEDLVGAPEWSVVYTQLADGAQIFAAHNAAFERDFFNPPDVRWIDTWKVAVTLWPEAPDHKLGTLRYWCGLKVDRAIADIAHRAGPDAYVGARLLRVQLMQIDVERAIEISASPIELPRFNFGKHARIPVDEIPASYLGWMLRQGAKSAENPDGFDENIAYTASRSLARRKSAAGA
jgi:exodeoxyribonuclease X